MSLSQLKIINIYIKTKNWYNKCIHKIVYISSQDSSTKKMIDSTITIKPINPSLVIWDWLNRSI